MLRWLRQETLALLQACNPRVLQSWRLAILESCSPGRSEQRGEEREGEGREMEMEMATEWNGREMEWNG